MAESRATLLKQIKQLQADLNKLGEKDIAQQKEVKKQLVDIITALKEVNKQRLANAADEEQSQKSLNGIYDQFKNSQAQTLKASYKGTEKSQAAAYEVMDINRSIAQLSSEDEYQKLALLAQRDDAMGKLDGRSKGLTKQLKEQNSIANDFGNMSESHKQILEGQKAVLDGIKNTIQGTIDTAVTLYGNLQGAIGGVITGLGFVVDKIGDANKELGTTMFQTDGVARSAGALSFFFDDAVQNAKDLSAELGDTGAASFDLQTNIGLMSKNMGISGTEATKLVGALSRLNDGSTDIASDMVATSREFAKQNGIIPAQLMGDLANSTEEFALFGKDGGKNILEAAGYAAKLGTNMSTLSGIADGLLDFETSITKELELGAMLGKNINLNKARELAYSGDIEGATRETLKQLGGSAAFSKMDYYQKKQTADLLGVSVAELQKMNDNMEQADNLGSVINSKFSAFNEIVNAGVNSALGTTLKTLGGAVTAAAQMGGSFAQMGFDVKGMASKLPGIGKFFGGGKGAGAAGGGLEKSSAASIPKGGGAGKSLKELAGGLKAMGNAKVLFGALNLIPTALGMVAMIAAIPGMLALSLMGVATGVGLRGLGKGLAAFGKTVTKALPQIGIGLLVLAGFGAAMIPLAYALGLAAPAISAFGDIIKGAFEGIASIVTAVAGGLIGMLGVVTLEKAIAMGVLAYSFLGLATSLFSLGIASLFALPGLIGLGFATMLLGAGFSLLGMGMQSVGLGLSSIMTSLGGLVGIIGPVTMLSLALLGLSGALMGLGLSLAFLGLAGLPGMLMLAGISAISGPIIELASWFGIGGSGGESEAGAIEDGSLSEYETNMLAKMDQLIQATTSQRDIYLDKDKVTNIVMDRGERSAVNKFKLNRA